jgi:Protein of unknown function (DUF992)
MPIHWLIASICGSAVMCTVATSAVAGPFRVGRLVCLSSPRVGLVLGSAQELRCVFTASRPPRQYVYAGRIRRVGLDLGVTSAGSLSWAVLARNARMGPGTLRGSYVGASGTFALGPGLGANVLIGGSRRLVMLQPLSIERSIGMNLAFGITNLTLRRAERGGSDLTKEISHSLASTSCRTLIARSRSVARARALSSSSTAVHPAEERRKKRPAKKPARASK